MLDTLQGLYREARGFATFSPSVSQTRTKPPILVDVNTDGAITNHTLEMILFTMAGGFATGNIFKMLIGARQIPETLRLHTEVYNHPTYIADLEELCSRVGYEEAILSFRGRAVYAAIMARLLSSTNPNVVAVFDVQNLLVCYMDHTGFIPDYMFTYLRANFDLQSVCNVGSKMEAVHIHVCDGPGRGLEENHKESISNVMARHGTPVTQWFVIEPIESVRLVPTSSNYTTIKHDLAKLVRLIRTNTKARVISTSMHCGNWMAFVLGDELSECSVEEVVFFEDGVLIV